MISPTYCIRSISRTWTAGQALENVCLPVVGICNRHRTGLAARTSSASAAKARDRVAALPVSAPSHSRLCLAHWRPISAARCCLQRRQAGSPPSLLFPIRGSLSNHSGPTTAIGLGLAPLLGGLAVSEPLLAAATAATMAVLFAAKAPLHRFVKNVLTEAEISDALIFAVATLVVWPQLPNCYLGPFDALNPHNLWLLVILMLAISACGHIATPKCSARVMACRSPGSFLRVSSPAPRRSAPWPHARPARQAPWAQPSLALPFRPSRPSCRWRSCFWRSAGRFSTSCGRLSWPAA